MDFRESYCVNQASGVLAATNKNKYSQNIAQVLKRYSSSGGQLYMMQKILAFKQVATFSDARTVSVSYVLFNSAPIVCYSTVLRET